MQDKSIKSKLVGEQDGHKDQRFEKVIVIFGTYAGVEPVTVMVEVFNASIAGRAVLCSALDMRLANVAVELILVRVEAQSLKTSFLSQPFKVYGWISRVNNGAHERVIKH